MAIGIRDWRASESDSLIADSLLYAVMFLFGWAVWFVSSSCPFLFAHVVVAHKTSKHALDEEGHGEPAIASSECNGGMAAVRAKCLISLKRGEASLAGQSERRATSLVQGSNFHFLSMVGVR